MSDELNRLKERLERDPDSLLFAQYADLLRKEGLLDEAIEIAEKGVDKHPEYATGFLVLGRCFKEKKAIEKAIKHLDTASKLDKQSILALKELSELYLEQKDNVNGKRVLNRLLELDPLDREAKRMLREIEEREGKEMETLGDEGLSSYFEGEEFPLKEEDLEKEEELLESEETKVEQKSSFEDIDIEGLKDEEIEEPELTEEVEGISEEVSEEEIESIFSFDEEEKEAPEELEKVVEPMEELEELKEEEEFEKQMQIEDKERKEKEEIDFEEFFSKGEEEIEKEEKEHPVEVIKEQKVEEIEEKEELELTDVFGGESIEEEIEEFKEEKKVEIEEEIEESVTQVEEKKEIKGEIKKEEKILKDSELAKIYESRGFLDKALEIYKKIYETNKSEEVKIKIEELKNKIDKKDFVKGDEEEDKDIFSNLEKKAPIETEEFKEKEVPKEEKGEEGEKEDFQDWIDGLSGK